MSQVERGSYYRNLTRAKGFELGRRLGKIGRPVDRDEWQMTPPTVNAYYEATLAIVTSYLVCPLFSAGGSGVERPRSPHVTKSATLNEIVFPAGILQAPMFSVRRSAAMNYGAIGMVIGHEITHGFDDEGRQYDGRGGLSVWWSPAANEEFEKRASCVERQFSAYEVLEGLRVNGKLTLGENIADLGGIKIAYAAYRSLAAEPEEAGAMTPEQQFFIGYAQAWCSVQRPETVRLRLATDPHAPPRLRVNGPLTNFPVFAKAFGCAEGTPMARPASLRCEVW